MKRQNILKVLFLSLVLSSFASCGLIEKWKTPEQPTDSNATEAPASESASTASSDVDDLFSNTMNETKDETALNAGSDAPSNITTETPDELKSLEDEFSGNATAKTEAPKEIETIKVEESLPVIQDEAPVEITDNANADAGKIVSYKVQKGETLMQIAFKIYGDISKWKSIRNMNSAKLGESGVPRAGMVLNYTAPARVFVWNPSGSPHLIKTGETLGTISNSVYQTPKKWKSIWENNLPLIKNPNVIFAGFTLYYKTDAMANYVQPKATQKKSAVKIEEPVREETKEETMEEAIVESHTTAPIDDAKVEQAISNLEQIEKVETTEHEAEIDLTQEVLSAPIRE